MEKDALFAEMEKDSKIDESRLEAESLNVPYLYGKWQRIYFSEYKKLASLEKQRAKVYKERMSYYMGRADDEAYKKEPLESRVIKTELSVYLEADDRYAEALEQYKEQKALVDIIEGFLKKIAGRSFDIKNAIEFMRFKNGLA